MDAHEFLKTKIGFFNSFHPFKENVDYEDIINWLEEYAEHKVKNLNIPTVDEKCLNERILSDAPEN